MKNEIVTVVGNNLGAINAQMVESILCASTEEAQNILQESIREGRYCPLIADRSKIKSIVILSNGQVYPSNFRYVTLTRRFTEATSD
jgi:hypothetical protein